MYGWHKCNCKQGLVGDTTANAEECRREFEEKKLVSLIVHALHICICNRVLSGFDGFKRAYQSLHAWIATLQPREGLTDRNREDSYLHADMDCSGAIVREC